MGLGGEAFGFLRHATELGPIAALVPLGYRTDTLKVAAIPGKSDGAAGVPFHLPYFSVELSSAHFAVKCKLA